MNSKSFLIDLAKQYPGRILVNIFLGFSSAFFNGVGTALIVPILLALVGQEIAFDGGPPILQRLLAPFAQMDETNRLIAMAGAVLFLIILKNVTAYLTSLSTSALNRRLTSDLQEAGLKLLLEVDLDFFKRTKSGDLMQRLGGEMNQATSVIAIMTNIATIAINILVFGGLLVSISWQLTLAAVFLLPLSVVVNQIFVNRARKFGRQIAEINRLYSGGLVELFSGIRLVKVTGSEEREYNRFSQFIREREKINLQAQMNSAASAPICETFNILILFVLVFLSRIIFANQLETLSTILLTYLVVLNRLMPFVSQLNSARTGLARASASVALVQDLLQRSNKSFLENGRKIYKNLQEEIKFEQISFAYPGCQQYALQDVNLTIPKGTTLALVGSSGAGKSTLADLLPRFYDVASGKITIDGIDIREFDMRSLRQSMGVVSQDTFLFNDTIYNNIAYGCTNVTEEEVIDALKRANAYDFVMKLSEGLNTLIGDRGVMLSGGQRQRLAIARALVQKPEILILDEATSALDTVSERLVQEAIDELGRDRTTLVIAHRLSTVQKADQIAVMEKGRVVELGTHKELLKQGRTYSKLCNLQFNDKNKVSQQESNHMTQVAQLSYELRTNLNAMAGLLAILNDNLGLDKTEHFEITEKMFESLQKMLRGLERVEKDRIYLSGATSSC